MPQKNCCYVTNKELERDYKSFVKNHSQKAKLKPTETINFKLILFFVCLLITIGQPQVSFISIITKQRMLIVRTNINKKSRNAKVS